VTWRVIEGDCVVVMAELDEASVDAVVTDPPYGLEFMGKEWDRFDGDRAWRRRVKDESDDAEKDWGVFNRTSGKAPHLFVAGTAFQAWCTTWAIEALRVLKPGGHLLSFGGTRTYHRLACALEDAGFEIRDCLAWLYGSGFPKSLDVSKAIDKAAGAERGDRITSAPAGNQIFQPSITVHNAGTPVTPDAERWQGWGTALKPAFEPIILARKPVSGTVAENVLRHGTGALNVDGTRIEGDGYAYPNGPKGNVNPTSYAFPRREEPVESNPAGRWPANVLLDPEAAAMLDEQSGERPSANNKHPTRGGMIFGQGEGIVQFEGAHPTRAILAAPPASSTPRRPRAPSGRTAGTTATAASVPSATAASVPSATAADSVRTYRTTTRRSSRST
jgi:hypothetical protein